MRNINFKGFVMKCSQVILFKLPQTLAKSNLIRTCRLFSHLPELIIVTFQTYTKNNKRNRSTKLVPFISFQLIDKYWHTILVKNLKVISTSRASPEFYEWIFGGDP